MNILQEIDSVLYYENLEKFWKQHRFMLIGGLIALFASVALFNVYNQDMIKKSHHDSEIILNVMKEKQAEGNQQRIEEAIKQVITKNAKEALKLELVKAYSKQGDEKLFESSALELVKSKNNVIKEVSSYMLAEFYLNKDANQAISFIDSLNMNKKALNYPLIQDIKAMALISLDKKDEAIVIYNELIQDATLATGLQARINNKLELIK